MIYTTNILALPLLMLAWSVDVYLFAAGLRLILGQLSTVRDARLSLALREIVDPLPHHVALRLSEWRHKPVPPWVPWTVIIISGLIVRHALMAILVGLRCP